jgi:uncharacterized membrane protein
MGFRDAESASRGELWRGRGRLNSMDKKQTDIGTGVGIGMALGAGVGLLIGNLLLGVVVGLAVGAGIGGALSAKRTSEAAPDQS